MFLFRKLVRVAAVAGAVVACGSDPTVSVSVIVNINSPGGDSGASGPPAGPAPSSDGGHGAGGIGGASGMGAGGNMGIGGAGGSCPGDAQCDSHPGTGTIIVEAGVDHCPDILTTALSQSNVPGTSVLVVTASDADGDPLTYIWTATAGTFSSPTSSQTNYTCVMGTQILTVRVSDGRCEDRRDLILACP
jgi:hypothetical protein